jgi:hypothetical protein
MSPAQDGIGPSVLGATAPAEPSRAPRWALATSPPPKHPEGRLALPWAQFRYAEAVGRASPLENGRAIRVSALMRLSHVPEEGIS